MAYPDVMEKLVSLCKRRGSIFQSSEIYGGAGSVWDYGPLGVELCRPDSPSSLCIRRVEEVGEHRRRPLLTEDIHSVSRPDW